MSLVIGLVSPVAWNVYEVCQSDMYLQVRQFFPQGYEPRGLVSNCNVSLYASKTLKKEGCFRNIGKR